MTPKVLNDSVYAEAHFLQPLRS